MATPPSPVTPVAVNHIGLTVPDIFAAIDWYGAVFGFNLVMGPRLLEAAEAATQESGSVMGPRFRRAYQAHLLAGNGVGIELFQFLDPPVDEREDEMVFWRRGLFHFCVTDPDIDGRAARIVAHGGKRRTETYAFAPGRPWQLIYCEDPWGTIIELFSHTYAEAFSNWPQPGMETMPVMVERPPKA